MASFSSDRDDDQFPTQDLGADFSFEKDPEALASILNNRGLTPNAKPKAFDSTLTPAASLPKSMKKYTDQYEFFAGKNGMVFYRPSGKFNRSGGKNGSASKEARGGPMKGFQAMKRGIVTKAPVRQIHQAKIFRSPLKPKSANKQGSHTEKKLVPFIPPPHRQSISERKPIPGFEAKPLVAAPHARKTLNFGMPILKKLQKIQTTAAASENDDDTFAKPLSPSPSKAEEAKDQEEEAPKSKAELILMREGLLGLPRESLSALLRQSLTKTELDRMFEDDSTESFEALERRMKTPKRAPPPIAKTPARSVKKVPHPTTPLQKSQSVEDLTPRKDTIPIQRPLAKSCSSIDLSDNQSKGNLEASVQLQEAQSNLAKFIEEREAIEEQMKELMLKSRRRREDFKLLWGVSPARVNSLRGQKTIFACHKIKWSEETKTESKDEEDSKIEATEADQIFSPVVQKDADDRAFLSEVLGVNVDDDSGELALGFSVVCETSDHSEEGVNLDEVEMELTSIQDIETSSETQKEERERKTVRFASTEKAYHFQEEDSVDQSLVHIHVPVTVAGRQAMIGVSKEGQYLSTSLHAPTPRFAKKQGQNKENINTPMALRALSSKAQQELESLYQDDDKVDARGEIDFDAI